MGVGGLVAIIGVWRSLVVAKYQVEREWLEGLVGKGQLRKSDQEKLDNMWNSAKEEAINILKQGKIEDYERFSLISGTLLHGDNVDENLELYQRLKKLERKLTKEDAKRILEQDDIDNYKKKEWQRLGIICYRLTSSHDPEAIELLKRLKELKYKKAKS